MTTPRVEPAGARPAERLIADLEELYRHARELRGMTRELLDRAYVLADELDDLMSGDAWERARHAELEREKVGR